MVESPSLAVVERMAALLIHRGRAWRV